MIDILLATYNGDKYIETQLSSIINQTYKEWRLLIHDDGSIDGTLDIIRKYTRYDDRITLIEDNKKNLGCGNNFIHLLQYSHSEYVCFCDQDDYWFENKLNIQYQAIKDVETNIPVTIIGRMLPWKFPENKISNFSRSDCSKKLSEFLFKNGGLQGCVAIFNTRMREYLLSGFSLIWMHDHIMALIALTFGRVIYINSYLILYRQHSANVTPLLPETAIRSLTTRLFTNYKMPVVYVPSFRDVQEFYRLFEKKMLSHDKKIFEKFMTYPMMNRFKRFFCILFSDFSLGKSKRYLLVIKLLMRRNYLG
ncbi:glycosyltransferase [Leadbettera azotonutricia]|uniref:Putative rhamnosyltransferase n=1 Tax=Leadbettera azotonutricia (strain ATCC BAA-888 / DSM 13862 / ZAS-9) TaxID=545695 RepID=F5YAJ9_LEAAZ|nr:glycosyltransferase [Leadbettera azotonutricia]AEF81816.1 putative rhamnosyltransferase [Leadbettera azotonutricia ZAS-9]